MVTNASSFLFHFTNRSQMSSSLDLHCSESVTGERESPGKMVKSYRKVEENFSKDISTIPNATNSANLCYMGNLKIKLLCN